MLIWKNIQCKRKRSLVKKRPAGDEGQLGGAPVKKKPAGKKPAGKEAVAEQEAQTNDEEPASPSGSDADSQQTMILDTSTISPQQRH